MSIFLWVLQVLLALHTAIGAVWKFSNSVEQTMPSLKAIPHGVWLAMAGVELLCALALILPAINRFIGGGIPTILAPLGAVYIGAELLVFTGIHLYSGDKTFGPIIYWLIVASICAVVAYGRMQLAPH